MAMHSLLFSAQPPLSPLLRAPTLRRAPKQPHATSQTQQHHRQAPQLRRHSSRAGQRPSTSNPLLQQSAPVHPAAGAHQPSLQASSHSSEGQQGTGAVMHAGEELAHAHAPSHATDDEDASGQASPQGVTLQAFESQTYQEQLEFLRSVLTPDTVAQIRASSTPDELQQIELVLQDVQKLEQMELQSRAQHTQSPAAAPASTQQQQQRRKQCAFRHTNVASRLAEERRLAAAEAEAAAAALPSVSSDFYSYLQAEVFPGVDGQEMRDILEALGQEQLEQLASVYNEMRSFVHQPPERMAEKYAELSHHMDALLAAAPEEPEEHTQPTGDEALQQQQQAHTAISSNGAIDLNSQQQQQHEQHWWQWQHDASPSHTSPHQGGSSSSSSSDGSSPGSKSSSDTSRPVPSSSSSSRLVQREGSSAGWGGAVPASISVGVGDGDGGEVDSWDPWLEDALREEEERERMQQQQHLHQQQAQQQQQQAQQVEPHQQQQEHAPRRAFLQPSRPRGRGPKAETATQQQHAGVHAGGRQAHAGAAGGEGVAGCQSVHAPLGWQQQLQQQAQQQQQQLQRQGRRVRGPLFSRR